MDSDFKYDNDNHVEKLRRLFEWSKGNPQPPFKMAMIPTNRCNLKCDACPNSVARKEGRFNREDEISKEKWMSIIEKGLDMGIKEWRILGGGEPLVRRDTTLSILYRVKRDDVFQDTEMITNGTLFQAKDIEKLVKVKTNRILLSIDGPDAETHDSIRGVKSAFRRATSSFRYFHKVKNRYNIDKPVIQVNTVLNNINYNKIIEMVRYADMYGAKELALHPMREYDEVKNQMQYLKLEEEQRRELVRQVKEARDIAEDLDLKLNLDMLYESGEYDINRRESFNHQEDISNSDNSISDGKFFKSNCFEPFYGFLVTPKGLVGQCVPYGMGEENLDLKERSLEDIWYGNYFEKIREKMLEHNLTDSCKKCGLLDMTEELRDELVKFIERK